MREGPGMNWLSWRRVAAAVMVAGMLAGSRLAAAEPLEVADVQASYTDYGPPRVDRSYFPGDNVCFRWHLSGDDPSDRGGVELDITVRLLDATQKSLFVNTVRRRSSNWK